MKIRILLLSATASSIVAIAPAAAQDISPSSAPSLSIGIERVGGIAFMGVTADDSDTSLSAFTMGIGGPTLNPFGVPRIAVDGILEPGVTLGAAVGVSYTSASFDSGGEDDDLGSLVLYTFTPRVGYRLPLGKHVDLTPRVGVTLMGGTVDADVGDESASLFVIAVGAEAPFAFRLTDSFHVLAAVSFDITLAGTASTESSSNDIEGTVYSIQGWLGLGGYL